MNPRSVPSSRLFNVLLFVLFVVIVGVAHAWITTGAARRNGAAVIAQTTEETTTLSASDVQTWRHGYEWYPSLPYCGPPFHVFPSLEETPGSTVAGYEHYYDKGKSVFGCPDGAQVVFRGTVWFDLGGIAGKAPPLHVAATRALLHFKKDKSCPEEEILIANKNWLKGFSAGELVPGDSFKKLPASASEDTVMDVTSVVNNWLRGADHGGYENYGFVFKGPREADLEYADNDACIVRYSEITLTLTYKYDKGPSVLYVPPPTKAPPTILVNPAVTRANVASAANGATATAKDFTKDGVIAGAHFQPQYAIDGMLHIHAPVGDLFWRDEHGLPTWLQVDFSKSTTISEINVFSVADASDYFTDPTSKTTFTKYGATAFDVQYWNGAAWLTVPGGSITANNLVWRKIAFPAVTTSKIRVMVNASPDGVARIAEVQAY